MWLAFAVEITCVLAKVRNPGLMAQLGLSLGLLGWLSHWIFWIVFASYAGVGNMPGHSLVIPVLDLFADAEALWRGFCIAVAETEWEEVDELNLIRGVAWLGELWFLLRLPYKAGKRQANAPFCEAADLWVNGEKLAYRFAPDHLLRAREHLVAHPEQLLAALAPLNVERPDFAT